MVVVADIFGICSIISLFFYFILESKDKIATLQLATQFLDEIEDDVQSYDDEDFPIEDHKIRPMFEDEIIRQLLNQVNQNNEFDDEEVDTIGRESI